jgi:hypothetical protein
METDGNVFLEHLSISSSNRFQSRFSRVSLRLGLGQFLKAEELHLLYEAAFLAALCNISFNGLGGCGGEIKPERETARIMLEREYMSARTRFFASVGWQDLKANLRESVKNVFLEVRIAEANMA